MWAGTGGPQQSNWGTHRLWSHRNKCCTFKIIMANNLSCKRKGFINKNWEISHQFLLGFHFKKLFLHLAKSKEINLISPYPTHTLHSHIPYEPFLKINQYLVTYLLWIFFMKNVTNLSLLSLWSSMNLLVVPSLKNFMSPPSIISQIILWNNLLILHSISSYWCDL